ncbi:response regulator [Azospirillum sp. RWY-5-1]|uniref:histidine kinase n=1 Tax=Azospirillum oleiclasticum TaxID=2735135 RepID=A0ABX2TCA2_9PROT|nr:hybrid sensor histidine kinase/response regulator [Azospirillum oleiclasticum]NYZ14319.1 response regulator [Azospirillum oleiclasticum]NYZ21804.1 response regulator [Azospirillum oleiclasticum]
MASLETLARAADLSKDSVAVLRIAGPDGDGAIITYANHGFLRLAAIGIADIVGEPLVRLRHPLAGVEWTDALRAALVSGDDGRVELAGTAPDGRPLQLELSVRHLPEEGLLLLSLRDVTETWRMIEELREAKELAEAANLAKSRFLASASHDLRQPLHAMSLLLGVLRNRIEDPELLPVTDQLQQSLDAMMELFSALLDISKFETGAVSVNKSVIRVDQLLSRIQVDFGAAARAKGVRLRIVGCPRSVWSDSMLLERMLRNLVSNAIRYTPSGGRVLLGARRRRDALRLDVLDTGPGIPPDQLRSIFEEFHQVGNPARQRSEGHGLGLAIVKRGAGLLGHRLDVASTPGRGSRFSVEVPLSADLGDVLQVLSARDEPAPATNTSRVVVVEDDPLVALAMRMVIEDMGCEVVVASDGTAAMAALSDGRPVHLILSDYRLGGGEDGITTVQKLRALYGPAAIAGIVTGDLSADIQTRAKAIGARCFLKPLRPEQLKALVAEAGC